jgi:N-acetylneuraminic acid mutarotase
MGGSNQGVLSRYSSYGQPGVYGTLGVFGAGNIPGGRSSAASWIDSGGNFWLFGGVGQDAGGDRVTLNDMWEFNPSRNQWAWMGGSNVLNPDIGSQWGVYGNLGIPAPENIPGSREQAATWTDSSGNFWLFGGSDPFGSGGLNMLNDLWKFNPSTKQWTWVNGPSTISCTNYGDGTSLYGGYFCGQLSLNGALGVPAAGNIPGGRAPAAQWIDSNGNLWLFGGTGLDHAGELINGSGVDPNADFIGPINDLWYYNPSTNLWTWMGGNTSTSGCIFDGLQGVVCGGQPGTYGIQGTPAGGNIPGSRTSAVSWSDKSGNLWLFSGWGQGNSFFSDVETYPLNDVWEYRPSTATLPATPTPVFGTTPGTYDSGGPVTIFDAIPNASIHYTTDGTSPTTASTLYSGPVTVSSSETLQAIATAPGYGNSGVASAAYVITPPAATPVFSVAAGAYTAPQTVTVTDATLGATISYSTDGGKTAIQYTLPIVVSSTEKLEAIATAPGYSSSATASANYVIAAQAATPVFSVPGGAYAAPQTVTITDATPGATTSYSTNGGTTMIQYTVPIVVSSTETLEAIATAPGYLSSATVTAAYTIGNPANSAPTIIGISPAFTSAGGAAFTLTVTGSGFTAGSTAYWGTNALTTTYGSTTQLTAQVPAADIATGGNTVGITVQTPSPGSGTSNAFQFEVDSTSGTTTGPTFTSTAATVSAGSPASYPVTFLSSVESASVTCLNLPAGAACSYSATTNTLTITTSSTTPKGTCQVTTVFSETISGAATSWILFPILLLPFMLLRRKLAVRGIWISASIGLVLIVAVAYTVGCGGGGGGTTVTPVPQTHQVVSSGSVSITIQ